MNKKRWKEGGKEKVRGGGDIKERKKERRSKRER